MDKFNSIAVLTAFKNKNWNLLDYLHESGCELNVTGEDGNNVLGTMIEQNDKINFDKITKYKVDFNKKDSNGSAATAIPGGS